MAVLLACDVDLECHYKLSCRSAQSMKASIYTALQEGVWVQVQTSVLNKGLEQADICRLYCIGTLLPDLLQDKLFSTCFSRSLSTLMTEPNAMTTGICWAGVEVHFDERIAYAGLFCRRDNKIRVVD